MNTRSAYPLASSQVENSPFQADDPAKTFVDALRRGDWNGAERQLRIAADQTTGKDTDAWALRRSDWYLAQQRWDEAATHLQGLLAEEAPAGLFQTIVRHKLASISFMHNDDAGCVAWLSPLLETDGVAVALPQGFRAAEILWVRALHRSRASDRLQRWATQLDARGQLDPAVAGVASLAMWEQGDLALAKHWIAMGRRGEDTVSAECLIAAAQMAMAAPASLAEAMRFTEEACARWPDDGRTWAAHGFVELLSGNAESANADLGHATATAPRLGTAWRGLGWAQILLGKPAAAEQSFLSALRLNDQHPESHGGLAVSLVMQRRESEAQDSLSTCRTLNAGSPSGAYVEQLLKEGLKAPLDLTEILARLN